VRQQRVRECTARLGLEVSGTGTGVWVQASVSAHRPLSAPCVRQLALGGGCRVEGEEVRVQGLRVQRTLGGEEADTQTHAHTNTHTRTHPDLAAKRQRIPVPQPTSSTTLSLMSEGF
jgi:hypothetical protein